MSINTKKYIEEYLKIQDKNAKIIPFCINKPQLKLYDALAEQHRQGKPQRAIVLKARQMGFSTLTEGIIFKKTTTRHNVKSGIVTHEAGATTNLFKMSKRFYDNLPAELKPTIKNSNAKELIFDNNEGTGLQSTIKCMTAGNDKIGRSDTFQNLHVSEYAFWEGDKRATLVGLMQTVPYNVDTLVIVESTANGYDEFKEMWDDAVAGRSDFTPVFCAWWELEGYRLPYDGFELDAEEKKLKELYNLDNEQLAWRRWCMKNNCGGDLELFHQEYPSCPEEAFIASGKCIFDKEKIIERMQQLKEPIKQGSFLYEYDGLKITNIRWQDEERGLIKIYKEPITGVPYVIGGDTAGEGSDNLVGQVIDNVTGEQVAVFADKMDEDLYSYQMYCLGMYYNNALLSIEANFSTYPVKELTRIGYTKQYVRQIEDTKTHKYKQSFGFQTNKLTRPLAISELVTIMREHIHLINDYETLQEALVFIKNDKGRPEAMEGYHDDRIMALAIAYYSRTQQTTKVKELKQEEESVTQKHINKIIKSMKRREKYL